MKQIFSKTEPGLLLHQVFRYNKISNEREDIVPENEFLQLAILKMQKGKTFKPHKHIIKEKITNIAQESWVVIKGSVKCFFYDIDDTIVEEIILEENDLSMTFRGGHNYEILENDTIVYEFKTGPYLGIEFDKKFI
jgi:cupin fold WbuC family metalloprotein